MFLGDGHQEVNQETASLSCKRMNYTAREGFGNMRYGETSVQAYAEQALTPACCDWDEGSYVLVRTLSCRTIRRGRAFSG